MAACACDFNRSMQHLISNYREEDVAHEAATKDLLHARTENANVGPLASRGLNVCHSAVI